MNTTDWCCAGCNKDFQGYHAYPPIKIPTGKAERQGQAVIAVEYYRYCIECAWAILDPTDESWVYREKYNLTQMTEADLEKIYARLS